jgi:hypothetical protein
MATVMLSRATLRLHRPALGHHPAGGWVTACGLHLQAATVGPQEALEQPDSDWCPDCWRTAADGR